MTSSANRRRYRRTALVAAVVFVTSVVELPDRGPPPRDPLGIAGVDKWSHLFGYAVLARSFAEAVDAQSWRSLAAVACLVTGYGAALEWLQHSLTGRLYERGDVAANALGALLGVATWRLHDATSDDDPRCDPDANCVRPDTLRLSGR
ncbi:VanZ family protein [Halomarina salina]|uniref:VanZ family protein n=1 Tax=Halomarina salina TaxID=1872699 RepID=A0ABD5RPM0_9EURY|nr:VanZ family protein [Halomarina salina]